MGSTFYGSFIFSYFYVVFALVLEMEEKLKEYLMELGIQSDNATFGFHWPPFISVKHLHMHCIAPLSKMNFISRLIFKPLNIWYCTVSLHYLI